MVTITNGTRTTVVTSGVYREMYAPQGWKIVDEGEEIAPVEEVVAIEEKTPEIAENEPPAEEEDYEEEIAIPEETMKPLSEMSVKELKQFAEDHNIDISSARNKQDIKAMITAEMEE